MAMRKECEANNEEGGSIYVTLCHRKGHRGTAPFKQNTAATSTPSDKISIPYISGPYISGSYSSSPYISGPYISSPYISDSYISSPYISGSYISSPYISGPYISSSYISGSYISGPYISSPYIYGPYISGSYSSSPYISGPYISSPYIFGSYISGPYISSSYISGPYISSPYISGPYISGSSLASLLPSSIMGAAGGGARLDPVDSAKMATMIGAGGGSGLNLATTFNVTVWYVLIKLWMCLFIFGGGDEMEREPRMVETSLPGEQVCQLYGYGHACDLVAATRSHQCITLILMRVATLGDQRQILKRFRQRFQVTTTNTLAFISYGCGHTCVCVAVCRENTGHLCGVQVASVAGSDIKYSTRPGRSVQVARVAGSNIKYSTRPGRSVQVARVAVAHNIQFREIENTDSRELESTTFLRVPCPVQRCAFQWSWLHTVSGTVLCIPRVVASYRVRYSAVHTKGRGFTPCPVQCCAYQRTWLHILSGTALCIPRVVASYRVRYSAVHNKGRGFIP
uniref:Uncharacterized protein n=1 Tax=Timema genevievae TaxID=629358 RepID=A0A7R9JVG4_TIMGE|nr:unnamed protein product [Timema genevievae]